MTEHEEVKRQVAITRKELEGIKSDAVRMIELAAICINDLDKVTDGDSYDEWFEKWCEAFVMMRYLKCR